MSRKLTTLKPRVPAANTNRVPILEAKAGTTPRIPGSKWVDTGQGVAGRREVKCQAGGRGWLPGRDQANHDAPLGQGGSNDERNLNRLCDDCHKAKTADE